jgi:uncharacterized protein HemX
MTTPTDQVVSGTLTHDLAWLRHHVILLAVVILLVLGSVYGIESVIAKHDHENALEKQAIAQTLVQQNQQFQQQTQAQINTLVQQNQLLQTEVGTLATAIATRDSQLRTQQAQVPQMTPDQLSLAWQKSIKNAGNIKPILNGYQVDQSAAVATLQMLEAETTLEVDKADLVKSNNNLQVQLVNETAIYEAEKKAHVSDNAANTAVITAKDAEIKDIKAQNRKRNVIVAVVAFLGGIIAHAAGL